MGKLPAADLAHILEHTGDLWERLRGARVFITGGTAFFGRWLVESFLHANARYRLGAAAIVLTRDPDAFRAAAPHLADDPALSLLGGELETFAFPDACTHLIHAGRIVDPDPIRHFLRNLAGTRRVLEFAAAAGVQRLLYTSSGAAYGAQPPSLPLLPEEYPGGPDPLAAGAQNTLVKSACEFLCAEGARQSGLHLVVARCFSFLGPHLALDGPFAAGNFIRDCLAGGPVHVTGDGAPIRSYLYTADLAVWLWTILLAGAAHRIYNVGAEEPVTIGELAHRIAACWTPQREVRIARAPIPGCPAARYIPDTARARAELGLRSRISLDEAIARTVRWYRETSAGARCGGRP